MTDMEENSLVQYTVDHGETWWLGGNCPDCQTVMYTNGRVLVCGQCDWWEPVSESDSDV